MTKPVKEELSHTYRRDTQFLFDVLYKTGQDAKTFQDLLLDLLTHSELRMLKRRWYVACLLAQGKPMREVAEQAGVGTDTVMRMSRRLHSGSGALWKAVKKITAIRSTGTSKSKLRSKKSTLQLNRWIFGASE